jgi:ribosomal protein L22
MSPEDKDELETPASEDVAPAEPLEVPQEPESASEDAAAAEAPSEPPAPVETDTPEAAAEDEDEAAAEDDGEDEAADGDEVDAGAAAPAARARRLRRPRRGADKAEPAADKPAKPTPARRKAKRDPNLPIPVVRAQAKYVRSSARKARLVCDNIRGKSVEEARAILTLTPRHIARDWSKLLESAVANAEHNHELVGEDLYVKAVHADEGPTIKRFQPRAMGRATKIRKRTSHLTILLTPKD